MGKFKEFLDNLELNEGRSKLNLHGVDGDIASAKEDAKAIRTLENTIKILRYAYGQDQNSMIDAYDDFYLGDEKIRLLDMNKQFMKTYNELWTHVVQEQMPSDEFKKLKRGLLKQHAKQIKEYNHD